MKILQVLTGTRAGTSFELGGSTTIGRDGTAKANVEASSGDEVWGVVYELSEDALETLDGFEGGYRREPRHVIDSSGSTWLCQLYLSDKTDSGLRPSRAYRDRMVRGAREHGLPETCIESLSSLSVVDD